MNDREQKIKEFKALDDISHVLTVPARYIGSVNPTEIETFIFKDDKFSFEKISYTAGLLKIIEEIIDNSVDAYLNSSDRTPISVKVNMTKTSVEVIDTGCGIPVAKYKDTTGKMEELNGKYLPELAWGRLKAGGSFKEHRVGAGTHGEGASLTNVFSKVFIGTTDDGKKKCKVSCKNNMQEIKTKVSDSSGKSGTSVYFEPDLARFSLNEITQSHFDLIYQRLVNLSISFPALKFYFNGNRIAINTKNFIKMFSENAEFVKTDKALIAVFPSTNDEFQQYSYVNGLRFKDGGVHVDYVSWQIINPIREKLARKYKSLKPADIKNRLSMVVFLNEFENPQFNSQTKDKLTNPVGDVSNYFGNSIDFERFAKDILKNDAIINPIVDMFKLKEELKARQELKKVKKIRVKSDKYMSPIGAQKYLFICEGQSAQSSLCSCIGRDGCGYYCCRGLPINCLDNSIQRIAANQEFKDVMNILDLDITKDAKDKNISFDKIVIAVDQDLDGIHLGSMLIGWFRKFAPNLFNEGRICKLQTPLIIVKDSKDAIKEYFFELDAFKKWEEANPNSKYKIFYQKGLGSIERSDMNWLMSQNGGMEQFLYELREDKDGFKNVDLWLTGDAEPRKEKLRKYSFDINMA